MRNKNEQRLFGLLRRFISICMINLQQGGEQTKTIKLSDCVFLCYWERERGNGIIRQKQDRSIDFLCRQNVFQCWDNSLLSKLRSCSRDVILEDEYHGAEIDFIWFRKSCQAILVKWSERFCRCASSVAWVRCALILCLILCRRGVFPINKKERKCNSPACHSSARDFGFPDAWGTGNILVGRTVSPLLTGWGAVVCWGPPLFRRCLRAPCCGAVSFTTIQ